MHVITAFTCFYLNSCSKEVLKLLLTEYVAFIKFIAIESFFFTVKIRAQHRFFLQNDQSHIQSTQHQHAVIDNDNPINVLIVFSCLSV